MDNERPYAVGTAHDLWGYPIVVYSDGSTRQVQGFADPSTGGVAGLVVGLVVMAIIAVAFFSTFRRGRRIW